MQKIDPYHLFASILTMGSLAGLASVLRSGKELTPRAIISAMLNSGLISLCVGLTWYEYFQGQDHVWFTVGVSLFAGLGGATALDFVMSALKHGIKVNVVVDEEDDDARQ